MEGRLSAWDGGLIRSIGGDLPDLLVEISRQGRTGTLFLECADGEKRLLVNEGQIIFAESSSSDDRLGEYLLRMGMLRLPDYLVLSSQVGKGKRLGALLVENGFLKVDELVPAVVGQVRRIVVRLFRLSEFGYRFVEQPLRKEAITLKMRLPELIIEGVQQVDSWQRLLRGMGKLDSHIRIRPEVANEFTGLKLSSEALQVLGVLENPIKVADVGKKANVQDYRCAQILWAFRSLGWIEEAGVAASSQDPVVGVSVVEAVATEPPPAASALPVVDVSPDANPAAAASPDAARPLTVPVASIKPPATPKTPPQPKPKPSDTLSKMGDFDFEISDLDLDGGGD